MMKKCTALWREAHLDVKSVEDCRSRSTFGRWDVEKVYGVVAKHIWKYKVLKTGGLGALLEVEMSKKYTALWREAHFEVKSVKNWGSRRHFGRSDAVLCGRWSGLCIHWKVTKTWGFCSIFKNDGRRGRFEEDLHRCIFRGRRDTRGIFSRDVRSSRSWFPERGCILAYQIISYAKMLFRDRCSISYDLD